MDSGKVQLLVALGLAQVFLEYTKLVRVLISVALLNFSLKFENWCSAWYCGSHGEFHRAFTVAMASKPWRPTVGKRDLRI